MRRIFPLILALMLVAASAFSQTPAKPYSDLAPRDTLTAQWLMGMFNTIYSWAQTANTNIANTTASVTLLLSGFSSGGTSTATGTSSVATTTLTLTFESTGLPYIVSNGSGAWGFDANAEAVASDGTSFARFIIKGFAKTASGETALIDDVVKITWINPATWPVGIAPSLTHPGRLSFIASTTADARWKLWVSPYLSPY